MRQPAATKTAPHPDSDAHGKGLLLGLALIVLAAVIGNLGLGLLGLGLFVIAALCGRVLRWAGRWQLEIGTGLAAWLAWQTLPKPLPGLLLIALAVPLLMERHARRGHGKPLTGALAQLADIGARMRQPYLAARVRRRFRRATADAGVPAPRIRGVTATPTGWRIDIITRSGVPLDWYAEHARHLATTFHAPVRVLQEGSDPALGSIQVITRDPLAAGTGPWVCQDAQTIDLWNPLPIGLDENGQTVSLSLFEQHVLIGGVTRAGKSNLATMLVAAGAHDPNTRLGLIDPKGGMEFGRWHASADRLATTPEEAVELLREFVAVMKQRQGELTSRKLKPEDGPLYLLVIDELAQLTNGKGKDKFNLELQALTAMGASVGVVVVACTQKPESKIVPTHIRDNFTVRIALRTMTPQASDTILGDGHAAAGYNAADIPATQKGRAWLAGLTDNPFRFRSFEVKDAQLDALVARAAELHPAPTTPPNDNVAPAVTAPAPVPERGESGETGEVPSLPPTGAPVDSPLVPAPQLVTVGAASVVGGNRSPSSKTLAVEAALLADPGASDRAISREVGCDHKTVGAARKRLGL